MASREGESIVLFYNINANKIWPDKVEWSYKRSGLWWECPYKKGATVLQINLISFRVNKKITYPSSR